LVDAICDGTASKASNARLVALEAEKEALETELATLEQNDRVVDIHPGAVDAFTRAIEDLQTTIAADPVHLGEAAAKLRRLIEKVEVIYATDGTGFELRVHGRLAELIALPGQNAARTNRTVSVVAGEGLEPPTLGL